MRLSRAEMLVLVYIGALAVAAVASWVGAAAMSRLVPAETAIAVAGQTGWLVVLMRTVAAVLLVAVLFGLLWLYPVIRRDAHERGRLASQSRSFMNAALTDALTGLRNRRYFDEALQEFMREFGLIDRPLAVLILDLDHFKAINDTYGHDCGDLVLRSVSLTLIQHTRYHDVLARIGGEEFAIVLPNTDGYALARLAERIRKAIEASPVVLDGVAVTVTASIGTAVWDGAESPRALVKRVDKNLYRSKSDGRNRVTGANAEAPPAPLSLAS